MLEQSFSFVRVDPADGDSRVDDDVVADRRVGNEFETDATAQPVELDESRGKATIR